MGGMHSAGADGKGSRILHALRGAFSHAPERLQELPCVYRRGSSPRIDQSSS